MKLVHLFYTAILLFLANIFEFLFSWSILYNVQFLFPAVIWHILGALLLYFGVKGKIRKAAHLRDRDFTSIKDEHLVPRKGAFDEEEKKPIVEDDEDIWTKLSLPVALFVPVLGILGITILVWMVKTDSNHYQIFEEYRDFIRFRQQQRQRFEKINVMEYAADKIDVEPVVDLLAGKDKTMVWGSIDVLSKMADEKAVGLIRKTMSRADMDVKFYSAWGLDRIENRFIQKRKEFERKLMSDKDVETVKALLKLMYTYLETNLPEGPLATTYAREALDWADLGRKKFPNDPELTAYRGVFLYRSGNAQEAGTILLDLFAHGNLSPAFIPDCAEIFFHLGEFEIVESLVDGFTLNPDNEFFLIGRTIETNLEDLREMWVSPRVNHT